MTTTEALNIHPAFRPIWNRIKERGKYSTWAHTEFWPETSDHSHIVQYGDGDGQTLNSFARGASLEEAAEELAASVLGCKQERHGLTTHTLQAHTYQDAKDAFSSALKQLETREYDREAAYFKWLEWAYNKLGQSPPAAIFLPTKGGWSLGTLNAKLDVLVQQIPDDIMGDVMEHPEGMDGFVETELGYQIEQENDNG